MSRGERTGFMEFARSNESVQKIRRAFEMTLIVLTTMGAFGDVRPEQVTGKDVGDSGHKIEITYRTDEYGESPPEAKEALQGTDFGVEAIQEAAQHLS